MLLDSQNMFTLPAGDSPTVVGNTDSTNTLDLGVSRDIGDAATDDLYLLCEVVTAFASGGSATLQVEVQDSPDNSTWTVRYQSPAIAVTSLVQGYKFLVGAMLSQQGTPGRYIKLTFVIGTAAMTAGTIKAAFVPALDAQPVYPRNYTA